MNHYLKINTSTIKDFLKKSDVRQKELNFFLDLLNTENEFVTIITDDFSIEFLEFVLNNEKDIFPIQKETLAFKVIYSASMNWSSENIWENQVKILEQVYEILFLLKKKKIQCRYFFI